MKKLLIILTSIVLASCTTQKNPLPSPTAEVKYVPTDPIELFLVELATVTKLPFDNPVKADIYWNEGETSSALRTYFGDSFLITHKDATQEIEKTVADYLITENFSLMKFNGSIGDDSRTMGYRRDNLICKTDYSIYPEESTHHLVVYCTDATKGTERK
jgi:hypothetical protein